MILLHIWIPDSASSLNSEADSPAPTSYFSDIYESHSPSTQRVNRTVAEDDGRVTRRTVNWEMSDNRFANRDFSSSATNDLSNTFASNMFSQHQSRHADGNPNVQWGRLAQDLLSTDGFSSQDLFAPIPQSNVQQQRMQELSLQLNRWRYMLSLILGLLIRISFMLSLGEEYVQVWKFYVSLKERLKSVLDEPPSVHLVIRLLSENRKVF